MWKGVIDVGERVPLIIVGLVLTYQSTTYKLCNYIDSSPLTLLLGSFSCQFAYFLLMAPFYHVTSSVQESGASGEGSSQFVRLAILYNFYYLLNTLLRRGLKLVS